MEYMSTAKDLAGHWGQFVLLICVVAIMLGLLIKIMKQTADSVSGTQKRHKGIRKGTEGQGSEAGCRNSFHQGKLRPEGGYVP